MCFVGCDLIPHVPWTSRRDGEGDEGGGYFEWLPEYLQDTVIGDLKTKHRWVEVGMGRWVLMLVGC